MLEYRLISHRVSSTVGVNSVVLFETADERNEQRGNKDADPADRDHHTADFGGAAGLACLHFGEREKTRTLCTNGGPILPRHPGLAAVLARLMCAGGTNFRGCLCGRSNGFPRAWRPPVHFVLLERVCRNCRGFCSTTLVCVYMCPC